MQATATVENLHQAVRAGDQCAFINHRAHRSALHQLLKFLALRQFYGLRSVQPHDGSAAVGFCDAERLAERGLVVAASCETVGGEFLGGDFPSRVVS